MIAYAASAIIGFLAVSVLIAILLGSWLRVQNRINDREQQNRRLHLVLGTCRLCGEHDDTHNPGCSRLDRWDRGMRA